MLLAVFLGGCLGGLSRYAVTLAWPADARGFPWATLVINLSGAFALALLLTVLANRSLLLRAFVGPGVLGAWTTFSAVTASTALLLAHHHVVVGIAYLAATAVGGLVAAGAGLTTGRLLRRVAAV